MKVLFCSDPLNHKAVDPEYELEYEYARKVGMDVYLFSLEAVFDGGLLQAVKRIPVFEQPEMFVYRGWMMKPAHYEQLYGALTQKNVLLINSPTEYRNGHYFPYAYEAMRGATPLSIWLDIEEVRPPGFDGLLEKMSPFGGRPVLVKDFVKSRKHEWKDACYIPDASDKERVRTVVGNFIERQGSELNEGIVIREFVELEQLAEHPLSGMPLSREYRLYFLGRKMIQCMAYWDEAVYQQSAPALDSFTALAAGVESRFFTMDIARTAGGDWIVIEIGDGQVSGLPVHADAERFYRSIAEFGAEA